MGKGKYLIFSDHIIRFKCPVFNKKSQGIQEKGKYVPFKGKKKSTESVRENDLLADIPNKVFKTTVLKMLTELKEDVKKAKKMCEQNGSKKKTPKK